MVALMKALPESGVEFPDYASFHPGCNKLSEHHQ